MFRELRVWRICGILDLCLNSLFECFIFGVLGRSCGFCRWGVCRFYLNWVHLCVAI